MILKFWPRWPRKWPLNLSSLGGRPLLKKPLSKVAQNSPNPLFSLTALTCQTAQTEEFMFQNVAYWQTVYRTGVLSRIIINISRCINWWLITKQSFFVFNFVVVVKIKKETAWLLLFLDCDNIKDQNKDIRYL